MKISHILTAVPSKRTRKPGTALAVGAVAMCLLLGVGMAQAEVYESVEKTHDGETVTAIRGLEIGDLVYDVEFPRQTGAKTYDAIPHFPTTFDFETRQEASEARDAVNSVLTIEDASQVGTSALEDSLRFNIGFREERVNIGVKVDTEVVLTLQGENTGAWGTDKGVFYLYNASGETTWADFTVVGFIGLDLPELVKGRR